MTEGSNGVSPSEQLEQLLTRLERCATGIEATDDQRNIRNLARIVAAPGRTRVQVRNLAQIEILKLEAPA